MKFICQCLSLLLLAMSTIQVNTVLAQGYEYKTSKGTEFIFTFQRNFFRTNEPILFVSSETDTTGVIELPRLGRLIPFTVEANRVTSIPIPIAMLPTDISGGKSNYGIRIVTQNPVSIHGLSQEKASTDAFLLLPVASLGKDYLTVSYSGLRSNFVIVATEDNTRLTIVSPIKTIDAEAGEAFEVTLNKLETYVVLAASYNAHNNADLTGVSISANKPIAVSSGTQCAAIPATFTACDFISEMLPPITAWGKEFISYPLATRTKGDLIRILASEDNTQVIINGSLVSTLAAGTYYDVITKSPSIISTSKPSLVVQYSLGSGYDLVRSSDPFMMLVVPTAQFLSSYTFATPDVSVMDSSFDTHFINIIIKTSALSTLRLNGAMVDSSLMKPLGNGEFSGGQIPLIEGSHSISASVSFGLYVYGFKNVESYGYPGGMSLEVINSINGDYKNVTVISTLGTKEIEIDSSSFTVQPKEIRQENGVTKIEWFFPEFSIGQVKNLDFEVIAKNLAPGERRVVTNNLEMTYQDLNGVEHRRLFGEQVLDVLSSGFALSVSTDKQIYTANETVKVSTTTTNLGDAQSTVTVATEIRDVNDMVVANLITPPAFVLAGKSSIELSPTEFAVGSTYAGAYSAHSKMFDSQGKLLAAASTSFNIVTDQEAVIASITASTDKYSYTKKDTVVIDALVKNLAPNAVIEDTTARLRIFASDEAVFWGQSTSIAQIAAGNQESIHSRVSLTGATAGTYQFETELINTDGVILASHQTSFAVVNDPLLEITGSVSASALEVGVGESLACTFVVNNTGDAAPNQKINLNLVRVDDPAVVFTEERALNLAAGDSESLSPVLPVVQQAGSYACVLEAVANDAIKILGSAVFNAVKKESPVRLTGDITLGEKARLLVLMDASATERTYLENLLISAGWFYTIVDNAAAFATEMNQGGYGVYALLGEKVTLDQATQTALNSNIAAGDGLIVAGETDNRHSILEQSLGIKIRGNEAYAKGVLINDNEIGLGWQRAFNTSSRVLNFTADGATVVGAYQNDLSGANTPAVLGGLGAAGRYGNFVLDNFTSLSSTIEGRLAVGGNLSLQSFSVGDKLDPNKLHDVVTVGGNVTFPSGRIYYGNLIAGGSVAGVGDAVRFGMATGAAIKGNTPVAINFNGEREYLQELSTNLVRLPANGTVKMQWGGLELKGDCTSSSQVFNVNGADLGVAHTFAASCIPANATVIFNVSGQSVAIKSMGMQSLTAIRDKVLFNFPQATSLSMTSVGIEGSILAPFAQVNQPAGRIDGQVIVKSWNSTTSGYMSIHNRFFSGDLSIVTTNTNRNAVSIYQYQFGKSVFAGFDVLAQAAVAGAGNENPFAQLLLSALGHVNPAPITARAGKTIPLVVAYENTGAETATGQLMLTVPGGFSVINAGNLTAAPGSNDWIAPFTLQSGTKQSQLLYVKLPHTGGGNLQLQLQTGVRPNWQNQFTKTLNLQP